jgi:hypothetical protein
VVSAEADLCREFTPTAALGVGYTDGLSRLRRVPAAVGIFTDPVVILEEGWRCSKIFLNAEKDSGYQTAPVCA